LEGDLSGIDAYQVENVEGNDYYSFIDFSDSLVGYWRGEDGAHDESDEYLELDGDGDYVTVPEASTSMQTADAEGSISMWVNVVDNQTLQSIWHAQNNRDRVLQIDSDGNLEAWLYHGTSSWHGLSYSLEAEDLNRWLHVVYYWSIDDSSGNFVLELYVDGNLIDSYSESATTGVALAADYSFGSPYLYDPETSSGAPNYFNGSIDNTLIFNRSLSASEISNLYDRGRREKGYSDASLVSAWRFDGDVTDALGLNDGTAHGDAYIKGASDGTFAGGATTGIDGKFGKAFEFDGSGDYISGTVNNSGVSEVSIAAWLKVDASTGTWQVPFAWGTSSAGNLINIAYSSDLFLTCDRYTASSSPYKIYPVVGEWYHLSCIYNGTHLAQYVNGVYNGTWETPVTISSSAYRIGMSSGGTYPFSGSMDEVMIFDKALSVDEVSLLHTYAG